MAASLPSPPLSSCGFFFIFVFLIRMLSLGFRPPYSTVNSSQILNFGICNGPISELVPLQKCLVLGCGRLFLGPPEYSQDVSSPLWPERSFQVDARCRVLGWGVGFWVTRPPSSNESPSVPWDSVFPECFRLMLSQDVLTCYRILLFMFPFPFLTLGTLTYCPLTRECLQCCLRPSSYP